MMGDPRPGAPVRSLARRIARDSLALAPSYVVPGIASLLMIPLLFRPLGAEGYGTWALIYAIANGIPVVTSSWLEAISVRFGHRPGTRAGPGLYAASVLSSCVAAAALAWLLIPRADGAVVAASVAVTGAVVAYLLVQARLQARLAFGAMSRSAAIRAVAGAVLAVTAAFVTGAPSAAALGAALGFGIGTLVALPAALRPVAAARPGRAPGSPTDAGAETGAGGGPGAVAGTGGELRFGAASAVAALAAYALSVGDRFVLSSLQPLAVVGTYAATYAVIDLVIRLAPSIVFGVVRPRLFRAWDRGDRGPAAEAIATLAVILAWGTAALAAGGVLVATLVPATLDPRLVGPIAVGLGAFVVGNAIALLYASGERQARLAVHVVVGAVFNIALNLALDSSLGATGAALATAASYLLVLALHVHGLRRTLNERALRDGGLAIVVLSIAGLAPVVGPVPGAVAAALAGAAALLRGRAGWRRGLRAPASD
jgi:O-antigen/teichoic acid export membrane protein